MYDNIGNKIKGLAQTVFYLEMLAAVIGGFALVAIDIVIIGFIIVICGPIVAWVSSWILYGFGELVENSGGGYSKHYQPLNLEGKQLDVEKIKKIETLLAEGHITIEEHQKILSNPNFFLKNK